jgi:hypothetical protein
MGLNTTGAADSTWNSGGGPAALCRNSLASSRIGIGGRGNRILTKTGKDPVMQRDRQTLTIFGGIAAILIGSAMLLEDAAVSFGPITAIIGGIAAIALAGLDRLKQRVATFERHLGTGASQPACGGRRAIRSRRRPAAHRAIARPGQERGMRRGRRSPPCRRALVAWSSPARAQPPR